MIRRAVVVAAVAAGSWALALPAQEAQKALENYESSVTVFGERLPAEQRALLETAAPVAVITREQIQSSGARTLQEVLQSVPAITLHSQTGNDREATVDLRAFPQGNSVAVFLDGVRLNDLQDNTVRWDAVPVEDLERVEVYAGASAPLYGGGALAGVVNLVTRRNPGIPRVDLTARAGSFQERAGRVHASGLIAERFEFYVTGQKDHGDGWRENDGHRLDDALARVNLHLEGGNELALLLKYEGGELRDPGALTAQELAEDRAQTPYNLYDTTRGRHRIASLRWSRAGEGWGLDAQAYARRHDRDTLTTGRFGLGFLAQGDEALNGLVVSGRRGGTRGDFTWELSGGAEAARGAFDAEGFYTDARGQGAAPASRTRTEQSPEGLWARGELGRGKLRAEVGVRSDRARYDYADRMDPGLDTSRTFRETTARVGLLFRCTEEASLFAAWSQGYRIPTVVDLFAYPGFYSNPDLRPAKADDWEVGARYMKGGLRLSATAYRMAVEDETVFVLTDPVWFVGQNRNVGESLREGVELQARADLGRGWSAGASGSYVDAAVTAGPYAGKRVPMTSRYQGTLWVGWQAKGFTVEVSDRFAGPQVLDNDLMNERQVLAGYSVVRAAASYRWTRWTFEASVDNLFGREYSGRGITNGFEDYFTPAAPRSARFSVTCSF